MTWQRARKPEQKEIRKRSILEAAYRLFESMEYEKISLNAVAREAELSKPAVYQYFCSKEEIFLQLFAGALQEWTAELVQKLDKVPSSPSPHLIARAWTQSILEQSRLLRLLPNLYTSLEKNSSEDVLYAFKLETLSRMERVGQAMQRLCPGLDQAKCALIQTLAVGLVTGLWPMFRPNEVMLRVMQRIDSPFKCLEFEHTLTHALGVLIKDAMQSGGSAAMSQAEKETGI